MVFYFLFAFSVAFLYVAMQISLTASWHRLHPNSRWQGEFPFVSVVIAARNEAENIDTIIRSILSQRYPNKFELILVDNHSTDGSLASMAHYVKSDDRIKIIDLSERLHADQAFKKHALTAGIEMANGAIVLTTDADCSVPDEWIQLMVGYLLADNKDLVTGPVAIADAWHLLGQYQQLELAGLAVATGGGIHNRSLLMANGANLAFRRQRFQEQGGYLDMPATASGDDVFLLQKLFIENPSGIGFLKDRRAVVTTQGCPSLLSLLQQRKRWASKARLYQHGLTQFSAIVVALNSILIILHLVLGLIWGFPFYLYFAGHLMIKIIADSVLLQAACRFFQMSVRPGVMVMAHFLNPLIGIMVLVMTLSSRTYQWKDRKTH